MENRYVGILIIGLASLIGIIVLLFNHALNQIVGATCVHGPQCSMYTTIKTQTWISTALLVFVLVIGLVIMFSKERERVIVKTRKVKDESVQRLRQEKEENLKTLNKEEKIVYSILVKERSMFQADLVEKSGFNKVKVTRILDRLEGRHLIERKRRGMNNIVILR